MPHPIPLRADFTIRPTPAYRQRLAYAALLRLTLGGLGLLALWRLL